MEKLFNRILVPVDFSSTSINTLERAANLAQQYHCSLHLLHVVADQGSSSPADDSDIGVSPRGRSNKYELEFQLARLAGHIRRISNNEVKAEYSIQHGMWNSWVIDLVKENDFDLVLLGHPDKAARKRKRQLDPDKIAGETDIPVITIPSGRRLKKFYSILIPVTDFLPLRKLVYGVYMASGYNASLKLLGVDADSGYSKTHYFLERSFDLIRGNKLLDINSEMSSCHSVAEAVLNKSINEATDLVILNPGMQPENPDTRPGWPVHSPGRFDEYPVLTVNPI